MNVQFYKGLSSNLPSGTGGGGGLYLTTDTMELYYKDGNTSGAPSLLFADQFDRIDGNIESLSGQHNLLSSVVSGQSTTISNNSNRITVCEAANTQNTADHFIYTNDIAQLKMNTGWVNHDLHTWFFESSIIADHSYAHCITTSKTEDYNSNDSFRINVDCPYTLALGTLVFGISYGEFTNYAHALCIIHKTYKQVTPLFSGSLKDWTMSVTTAGILQVHIPEGYIYDLVDTLYGIHEGDSVDLSMQISLTCLLY